MGNRPQIWIIFLGCPHGFSTSTYQRNQQPERNYPRASKPLAASYPKLDFIIPNPPNLVKCLPEPRTCAMSWVIHQFGPKKKGAMEKSWDGMEKKTQSENCAKNVNPPKKRRSSLKWETPKSSKRIDIYSEKQWFFWVPQV